MKTEELVAALRQCGKVGAGCDGCPFENSGAIDEDWCGDALVRAAADRLEEYVDRCARFSEEIMVLRAQRRWIPVEERLPDSGENVLVVAFWNSRWGVYMGSRYARRDAWSVHVGFADSSDVTVKCWMPLPTAQEEVNNGKDG